MSELTRDQLIRRLHIIKEDVNNLYALLGEMGVDTSKESKKRGVGLDTYVTNIEIVCDVDMKGIPTDVDGYRVETEWTTEAERNERTYAKRLAKFDKIIEALREAEVDGEMMQHVIEKLGMNDQMLRQLVMTNPYTDTHDILDEKVELDNQMVRSK